YQFRRARLEDIPLLTHWRQQSHVRKWWGDEETFDSQDLSDPRVAAMIVTFDGEPFAYMQDYDVHGWDGHHFGYLPQGSRGIDQFIGKPAMLGLGHGTGFLRQRVAELFAAGASVIGTDPHPTNSRAIAVYAKVGFRVTGQEQETGWGRVIRMEAWRP
ncbi:MAG: N-acetyltransferase, partial [Hyphomicrobiales bacterium]